MSFEYDTARELRLEIIELERENAALKKKLELAISCFGWQG